MRISQALLLTSVLWGVSQPPTAAQAVAIPCPSSLTAPFGGMEGWSTINVQANFAKAVVDERRRLMTCQYGFGQMPEPFFGIQKPCPMGRRCVVKGNGFRLLPE